MEKIESFKINHDTLQKGMYISRIDGDIVTYDIRMKRPNMNDFLSNEGKIPGTNKEECGNYLEHDLDGAKAIAVDMLEVLKDWNEDKMYYAE